MKTYCVNDKAQSNGDHEVHTHDCRYLPKSRTMLGDHLTCHSAVVQARKTYSKANGCKTCCNICHAG